MYLKNFEELVCRVKQLKEPKRVVVAAAEDEHTIEAVINAQKEGIILPIFVGNKEKIIEILKSMGIGILEENIYHEVDVHAAATKAVSLIHEGKGDFLMKGKMETADILKAVVNKETGLGMGKVMSHFVINQLPHYHKLLVTTDGGMMTYPTLEQKQDILENAVDILHRLDYEMPKVAVVAAIEKVNAKMPETIEADQLMEKNKNGEIKNCIVAGPISLDIALDKEVAEVKGYEHPVAGDADIILVPNIQVGNVLGKSIVTIAGGKMAGFIVGAKVPIVMTSRGSSAEEKFLSLVLAAATT